MRLKTNRRQSVTSIHTQQQRYKFLLQLYELQQTVVEWFALRCRMHTERHPQNLRIQLFWSISLRQVIGLRRFETTWCLKRLECPIEFLFRNLDLSRLVQYFASNRRESFLPHSFLIHSHSPADCDSSSILRAGMERWVSSSVTEVGRLFLCIPTISLQEEKAPF